MALSIDPNSPAIRLEIRNETPVELDDLSGALHSLADEYRRWLAEHRDHTTTEGVRLYVKEIRSGSIIADLVALSPAAALVFVENANTVIEFCGYLKRALSWLISGGGDQPQMTEQNLTNLSAIIEPVAKDSGAQLNINTLNVQGPVLFTLNSEQANAAQNRARRQIDAAQTPQSVPHKKVALHWYQARNDPNATVGDKAIIESIQPRPVKAVFVNEGDKRRMLQDPENPFRHAYVVDVTVETVKGRPALYRIMDVHEVIDLDET